MVAALLSAVVVYFALALASGRPVGLRRPQSRPAVSDRQTWLLQAGTDLTAAQFRAGSVVAGMVCFVVLLAVTATPAAAVVPALVVTLLPRVWFARQRAQRLRELQEAWPDGLRDLVASTSAGLSLHQAILALAAHGPAPLRVGFHRYPTLARVVGVVPALEAIKEELADPTSDRVLEILILAHRRGGHVLGDVLRDLADATTRDVRVAEQIVTDGLEQRINARTVFVLPWLVLLALTAQDGFFRDFYRTPAGIGVVVLGGLLSAVGIAVVARLGREPVEERVLGGAARSGGSDQ